MKIDLTGKTALVTGGSRGIGRAVSVLLGELGVNVCVNYLRKKSGAEEVVKTIKDKGGSAFIYKADVGDSEKCREMMIEIKDRFKKLDILVCNAVFGVLNNFEELKHKHWQKTIETNSGSMFTLSQEMVKMNEKSGGKKSGGKKSGGHIIAVSSLGAVRSIKGYSIIGASKAALESLVRHLAVELGPKGYRVNAVAPGLVNTDSLSYFPNRDRMISDTIRITPTGRIATPEDVANTICLLCSNFTEMINGQVITIDGGASVVS